MNSLNRGILWLLLILGIIGSGLWIIGGKKTEHVTDLVIDASPEVIFECLTDPEHLKQWVGGLADVEPLVPPEEGGRRLVDSKTQRMVQIDGQLIRFEDQVIRYEVDKVLSIRSSNSSSVITSFFELKPQQDESSTKLVYRINKINRGIGRLTAMFRSSDLETRIDSDVRQLKKYIESDQSLTEPQENLDASESS